MQEQLLAELVEMLDFAVADFGQFGLAARADGEMADQKAGTEENRQSDDILWIEDGEGADRRKEKVVVEELRREQTDRGNRPDAICDAAMRIRTRN